MNANELANELEKGGGHYMLNIASMLRQQANRIAKLEEELKEEKEHSAILEKDRDVFLAENEVWKKYFEAFHKACESNNKQRRIIFDRNAEIKKLQAEIEALKCHCGRPLFETQDIIHTKTECLMRKAQKK